MRRYRLILIPLIILSLCWNSFNNWNSFNYRSSLATVDETNYQILDYIIAKMQKVKFKISNFDSLINENSIYYWNYIKSLLKDEVINLLENNPYVLISEKWELFKTNNFFINQIIMEQYNITNKTLAIELFYQNITKIVTIELDTNITDSDIIKAVADKFYMLKDIWEVYEPEDNIDFWINTINARIQWETTNLKINDIVIELDASLINCEWVSLKSIKANKIQFGLNYKGYKDTINIKTKYFFSKEIMIKLSRQVFSSDSSLTGIFHFAKFEDGKEHLLNIVKGKFTNTSLLYDGFKVSWELELIDIKTLDENKKISPWGDPYPLQIFYLNEYLINFNIQFVNPTMENKSLVLQEAIMNNVQADITKLDVVNFSGIQGNWLANDIENTIKDLSITISGNEFLYSELFNLKNLYIENIFSYEKRELDHILWIAIGYEELDIFIIPIKIKIYAIKQSTIVWRQIYKWAMLDENNNRQKPRIKQFLQASRMRQLYESDITLEKFNWLYLGYISYHWKKLLLNMKELYFMKMILSYMVLILRR